MACDAENPVKVAVALNYAGAKREVPRVVAKGQGDVADRIVAAAEEAGVPVERDAELAKALAQLDLEQAIPPELYRAVAALIGFLMKRRGGLGAGKA